MNAVARKVSDTRLDFYFFTAFILIAMLFIVPELFQFRAKTRVLGTQANLSILRDRIELFKTHEGRYPTSLGELLSESQPETGGFRQAYLDKVPPELISAPEGFEMFWDVAKERPAPREGGWIYHPDAGEVQVNFNSELNRRWGEFSGQIPSRW